MLGATILMAAVLAQAAPEGPAAPAAPAAAPAAPVLPATNELCPVMEGNKVDPNIFVIYKGKRVQFCCLVCKAAFEKDPEKYLPKLPQFAGTAPEPGKAAWTARLIEPTGVVALVLLIATMLGGLFVKKAPRLLFKSHRVLAVIAMAAVVLHAVMVWVSEAD